MVCKVSFLIYKVYTHQYQEDPQNLHYAERLPVDYTPHDSKKWNEIGHRSCEQRGGMFDKVVEDQYGNNGTEQGKDSNNESGV